MSVTVNDDINPSKGSYAKQSKRSFKASSVDPKWRPRILRNWLYALSCFAYWLPGLVIFLYHNEIVRNWPVLGGFMNYSYVSTYDISNSSVTSAADGNEPASDLSAPAGDSGSSSRSSASSNQTTDDQTSTQSICQPYLFNQPCSRFIYLTYLTFQGFLSIFADYIYIGRLSTAHLIDTFFAVAGTFSFGCLAVTEYFTLLEKLIGIIGLVHAAIGFGRSRHFRRPEYLNCEKFMFWHIQWHVSLPFWCTVLILTNIWWDPDWCIDGPNGSPNDSDAANSNTVAANSNGSSTSSASQSTIFGSLPAFVPHAAFSHGNDVPLPNCIQKRIQSGEIEPDHFQRKWARWYPPSWFYLTCFLALLSFIWFSRTKAKMREETRKEK